MSNASEDIDTENTEKSPLISVPIKSVYATSY